MDAMMAAGFDWGALALLIVIVIGVLWALRLMLRQNRQDLKSLTEELNQEEPEDSSGGSGRP
ncbi:MAG TPA: hypothetical protein PKN13_09760 [Accumulibacter sp.]|nr:hypothetical protein [Accumulibacter sp.]HMW19346.1 hypothetical protein [Accumulibacter sp.]HNC19168.1 hypothetical protein [Accumulibacter sp.]HND80744.1 hypothetical protein [Accumulibacter sp.]HNG39172.1 hypothetical protein [Accumulibacter sp.]